MRRFDVGTLRILTVSSVRLGAIYPNKAENISAEAGEKLLIVRGTLQNPSVVVMGIDSDHFLRSRFWDGKGKGEFKYVGIYDPETHERVHSNLSKGQSTPFECVIRVPASFNEFRVGFYPTMTAQFAFRPNKGQIPVAFRLTINSSQRTIQVPLL